MCAKYRRSMHGSMLSGAPTPEPNNTTGRPDCSTFLATRNQVSQKFGAPAPVVSNSGRHRISESNTTTSVSLPTKYWHTVDLPVPLGTAPAVHGRGSAHSPTTGIGGYTVETLFAEASIRALLGPRIERTIGPVYQGYIERSNFRPAPRRSIVAPEVTVRSSLRTARKSWAIGSRVQNDGAEGCTSLRSNRRPRAGLRPAFGTGAGRGAHSRLW